MTVAQCVKADSLRQAKPAAEQRDGRRYRVRLQWRTRPCSRRSGRGPSGSCGRTLGGTYPAPGGAVPGQPPRTPEGSRAVGAPSSSQAALLHARPLGVVLNIPRQAVHRGLKSALDILLPLPGSKCPTHDCINQAARYLVRIGGMKLGECRGHHGYGLLARLRYELHTAPHHERTASTSASTVLAVAWPTAYWPY